MKQLILTILSLALLLPSCYRGKNLEYNIYQGLREEDKAFIRSEISAGKELYKVYCSDCHGIFTKGKDDITNFSKEQLHDYKSSFVMKDEENHSVATNLSTHELDQILMFLMFLKRDGDEVEETGN